MVRSSGALVLEILVAFFGSATAPVSFLPNCAGCNGAVNQTVYPGDYVQYVCFVNTTAGMIWNVFSNQRVFPGASSVEDVRNIDDTYFIVLTNTTGGFTSTLSFVSNNDQDGLSISCQDLTDQKIVSTQLFFISAPPSPEITSVVYSNPTTVTVTWNQLSSEYRITEYRVNVTINGLQDTRTVTEPSITIMDVGVDDTLTITVTAVDEIDRVGTFSDTRELNYTRDRPQQLQMPTINYLSPNELFIDWDNDFSLSEYQISHYMVKVTINSLSEISRVDESFIFVSMTPGDSVSVSVAAVDEAGRYSDPGTFDNMSPSEDSATVSLDVYDRENNLNQIISLITVATSTNRPPINNYTITGSIYGVTVYYDHSELYYTFPVSKTNKMQSLCLVVEVFNDIGSTVVYNNCIDISKSTYTCTLPEFASFDAVAAAGTLGGVLVCLVVLLVICLLYIKRQNSTQSLK